jgi:hypothetical protein
MKPESPKIDRDRMVSPYSDRIDVRLVARIVGALTFDAKGRPNFTPISDATNLSYEFRVRPIAGNPEMPLVQSERTDFALREGIERAPV